MEKIKQTSKIMAIMLKVLYICAYVGMGFLIAGLIFLSINGSINEIHLGDVVNVRIPIEYEDTGSSGFAQLIAWCVLNIAACQLGIIILKNAYMIFKDISITARPFEKIYVKRLKTIALIMIVSDIGLSFVQGITEVIMGVHIGGRFDSFNIFAGVLIYCLALIFDYRADLQKQYDETI
jgi:hypothetical protein